MPGLVKKLLVIATLDGLVLQPLGQRHQRTGNAVKIDYKSHKISPLHETFRDGDSQPASFDAYGIVGLLKVSSSAYLISISQRQQVAQIRGKPVYVITDVALTPLTSYAEAETAIIQTRESLQKYKARNSGGTADEGSSDDEDSHSSTAERGHQHKDAVETPVNERSDQGAADQNASPSTVATDVLEKRGAYGRFAESWFSRRGWTSGGKRQMGLSSQDDLESTTSAQEADAPELAPSGKLPGSLQNKDGSEDAFVSSAAEQSTEKPVAEDPSSGTDSLIPKILRTTIIFFSSRNFFFSYDYDLSRRYQHQQFSSAPLYKQFDRLFYWNRYLQDPLIQGGQHDLVLPLIQGFVGQRAFSLNVSRHTAQAVISDSPEEPRPEQRNRKGDHGADELGQTNTKHFLLTLISRRSVRRAGLRYLRRGIDDEGNVANSVESEQVLFSQSSTLYDKVYSLTQVRGSIPLYFSQTPYTFKPVPVFTASAEASQRVIKQHFQSLISRYGDVQVVSLIDKHGSEVKIGKAYEDNVKRMNDSGGVKGRMIGFEWFDFHTECRGMNFENVSILINTIGPTMDKFGWLVQQHVKPVSSQSGIIRTNCMDCLDRTNVVQSACARKVLEAQLADQGITIDLQDDPTTSWFNTLWADNGDAVSKQYSGTAALKGDFTRTRKRNFSGALTDFGLTLSRYYNNMVNDYFTQACIDYYLGGVTDAVFEEFEANMMSADPSIDLKRLRQDAIEACVKIVIEDLREELIAGWTLSSSHEANTLRRGPFEEVVLLLTDVALYRCSFDWNTEKVHQFERIELGRIQDLYWGAYITSVNHASQRDEKRNVGLAVRYRAGEDHLIRVNTRSLDNEKAATPAGKGKGGKEDEIKILAFKALPVRSSSAKAAGQQAQQLSERDLVKHICEEIERMALAADKNEGEIEVEQEEGEKGKSSAEERKQALVEEKDIISLEEAKKSTGYLETLGYSMKKLIWG